MILSLSPKINVDTIRIDEPSASVGGQSVNSRNGTKTGSFLAFEFEPLDTLLSLPLDRQSRGQKEPPLSFCFLPFSSLLRTWYAVNWRLLII